MQNPAVKQMMSDPSAMQNMMVPEAYLEQSQYGIDGEPVDGES
jgi:hypothetical protein